MRFLFIPNTVAEPESFEEWEEKGSSEFSVWKEQDFLYKKESKWENELRKVVRIPEYRWFSPSLCKIFRWLAWLTPPWDTVMEKICTEFKDGEVDENSPPYTFFWAVCLQVFDIVPYGIQARWLQRPPKNLLNSHICERCTCCLSVPTVANYLLLALGAP